MNVPYISVLVAFRARVNMIRVCKCIQKNYNQQLKQEHQVRKPAWEDFGFHSLGFDWTIKEKVKTKQFLHEESLISHATMHNNL